MLLTLHLCNTNGFNFSLTFANKQQSMPCILVPRSTAIVIYHSIKKEKFT